MFRKTLVWVVPMLFGAAWAQSADHATDGGAPPSRTAPLVEWLDQPQPTVQPQTPQQEERSKTQGRVLPQRELLQPTVDPALPDFRPCQHSKLTTHYRIASSDVLPGLVRLWIQRFNHYCPNVRIELSPPYAGSLGAKALIGQKIDFVFVSRELKPDDVEEFRKRFAYPPLSIPVSGGSYRHFGFLDAIGFFVNKANPLERITYAQLDAILSSTRYRGGEPITRWGQLGLTGDWADKPIHVYAVKPWNGFEEFIRQRVLSTADQRGEWRTDLNFDPLIYHIADHVAEDPLALGYSGLAYIDAGVRSLSVATGDEGPYFSPSYENVALGEYPLGRLIYINLNRAPGQALPPALTEFMRFVLSREGQQAVLDEGIFLPLRESQAAQARSQID